MLLPSGFPTDLDSFLRSGLGQLTTSAKIAKRILPPRHGQLQTNDGLFGKIERIYREGCDFEATLLLSPAPCGEGYVPDLRLTFLGLVEEACVPRAVGGTRAAPLHRYAVAWDLHYHSRGSLRGEE